MMLSLKFNKKFNTVGFVNDIDGGMPFWPQYHIDNCLYKFVDAADFIKMASVSSSAKMKEIAATLTEEMLKNLAQMGFNRVSYGVQDFDLEILKNIGRDSSLIAIPELLSFTRELGFKGINIDLVYGLPGQTEEGFAKTIEKAIEASSDRIALFSYAHVPWMRPEQKKLEAFAIPEAKTKMTLFLNAREAFLKAGYLAVGMDHFVKPSDALAKASLSGMLHRNFQGYCTRETTGQVSTSKHLSTMLSSVNLKFGLSSTAEKFVAILKISVFFNNCASCLLTGA